MIYDYTEWGPRFVPGTVTEDRRGFIYLEATSRRSFLNLFSQIGPVCIHLLKSGGAIGVNTEIQMPSGVFVHGMSYKGDLEGWHSCITSFCEKNGIIWGKIEDNRIVLTNGESAALNECKIEMW